MKNLSYLMGYRSIEKIYMLIKNEQDYICAPISRDYTKFSNL